MQDSLQNGGTFTYSAFISYSRRDRTEAIRLQRLLEQFRLDPNLRNSKTPPLHAHPLRPVFRDEDELVPGQDLPDRIRKGLAASRFLIVLASRAATKSEWVTKEILDYIAQGMGNNIIVLILDGEPNAGGGKVEKEECLPLPLRVKFTADGQATNEPVPPPDWIDWRGGQKSDRLNFLRVVAALLELTRLDELVQRDLRAEARGRRNARAIAAALFVLALLSAVATYFAFDQRTASLITESKFLSTLAEDYGAPDGDWRLGDPVVALQVALAGAPTTNSPLDRPWTKETENAIRRSGSEAMQQISNFKLSFPSTAIALSPNGELLAVAGKKGNIYLLEPVSGKILETIEIGPVTNLTFSHDGAFLAAKSSSEKDSILIWDIKNKRIISTIKRDGAEVLDIAISPDDKYLLAAYGDNAARVWTVETPSLVATLTGHTNRVTAVSFSSDGKMAITGSNDRTALVWDTSNWTKIGAIPKGAGAIRAVAVTNSTEGTIAATNSFGNTIRVYDVKTQQLLRRISLESPITTHGISFGQDLLLSSTEGGLVQLWEIRTGVELKRFKSQTQSEQLSFSNSNTRMAGLFSDKAYSLSGERIEVWETSATRWNPIAIMQDVSLPGQPPSLRVGEPISQPNEGDLQFLSLAPNDIGIIGARVKDKKWKIIVNSTSNPKNEIKIDVNSRPTQVAIDKSRKYSIFALEDQSIIMLKTDTWKKVYEINPSEQVRFVRFADPLSRIIFVNARGDVNVFDPLGPGLQKLASLQEKKPIHNINIVGEKSDLLRYYTGDFSVIAQLKDFREIARNRIVDATLSKFAESANITVKNSGNIDLIALIDESFSPPLSSITNIISKDIISGQERAISVGGVARIFAVGRRCNCVAFGTRPGSNVLVYDLASGVQRFALTSHTSPVTDIKFLSGDEILLTAGADGSVRLWDVATGQELAVVSLSGYENRAIAQAIDANPKNDEILSEIDMSSIDVSASIDSLKFQIGNQKLAVGNDEDLFGVLTLHPNDGNEKWSVSFWRASKLIWPQHGAALFTKACAHLRRINARPLSVSVLRKMGRDAKLLSPCEEAVGPNL